MVAYLKGGFSRGGGAIRVDWSFSVVVGVDCIICSCFRTGNRNILKGLFSMRKAATGTTQDAGKTDCCKASSKMFWGIGLSYG